jgi:hypothetical protein
MPPKKIQIWIVRCADQGFSWPSFPPPCPSLHDALKRREAIGQRGGTRLQDKRRLDLIDGRMPDGRDVREPGRTRTPQGQHRYQWTVEAQDGNGRALAVATVTKKFPER